MKGLHQCYNYTMNSHTSYLPGTSYSFQKPVRNKIIETRNLRILLVNFTLVNFKHPLSSFSAHSEVLTLIENTYPNSYDRAQKFRHAVCLELVLHFQRTRQVLLSINFFFFSSSIVLLLIHRFVDEGSYI